MVIMESKPKSGQKLRKPIPWLYIEENLKKRGIGYE